MATKHQGRIFDKWGMGTTVTYGDSEIRWQTKDSGKRAEFDSGMVRDTEEGKPRFDLLLPLDVPFKEQMLTRFADLMARGAEKYTERNWEQANSQSELDRYYSSAFRHFMQWVMGETDEDHAAAVFFNINAAETVKYKMKTKKSSRHGEACDCDHDWYKDG